MVGYSAVGTERVKEDATLHSVSRAAVKPHRSVRLLMIIFILHRVL